MLLRGSLGGRLGSCIRCCVPGKAPLFLQSAQLVLYVLLLLLLLSSCGGGGSDNNNDAPLPVFMQLSPVNPEIVLGTTVDFTATAVYADGTKQDVTDRVAWSLSNDLDVVFMGNRSSDKGRAYALSTGTVLVTASLSGQQASTEIVVSEAQLLSLELSAQSIQIANGTQKTLTVLGRYSNNTSLDVTPLVTWSIVDNTIASISGIDVATISGTAVGDTQLQASLDGITTSAPLSVTNALLQALTIEPSTLQLSAGLQTNLAVYASYSDGTQQNVSGQVSWLSSSSQVASVADITQDGATITAKSTGSVIVTASMQGADATAALKVIDAVLQQIHLSPAPVSLAKGTSLALSATGLYSDNSVEDISEQVIWQSSNTDVLDSANVAGKAGVITALQTGEAQVTASLHDQVGSINVTVTAAQLVSINVTPLSPSIAAGTSVQLNAIGNYSDGGTQDLTHLAGWDSGDTGVAVVANNDGSIGLLRALAPGSVTVSANYAGVAGTVSVTVTDAVLTSLEIDQADLALAKGTSTSLTATARFSDGSEQNYTQQLVWQSSAVTVATVSSTLATTLANGAAGAVQVLALNTGSSNITASLPGSAIAAASMTITVTDAVLEDIVVTPQDATISNNTTLQFTATGHFTDGSTQDMTHLVSWVSTDSDRIAIGNHVGSYGLASGVISAGPDSIVSVEARYSTGSDLVLGSANVTAAYLPQKPVSLIVNALPNIVLSDGNDAAQLDIVVQAAEQNQNVVDGTTVDLEVLDGDAVLQSDSVDTVDGVATVSFTSAGAGLVVLRASVAGTEVSNTVSVLVVASFEEAILGISTAIYSIENNIIQAGAKFIFYITNNSNREFELTKYEFLNNNSVVGVPEANPDNLNGGRLPGGETVGIVANLSGGLENNGTSSRFTLVDTATGQEFTVTTQYDIVP